MQMGAWGRGSPPLLQVWPSRDSPSLSPLPSPRASDLLAPLAYSAQHDSGIDSVQASPSPGGGGGAGSAPSTGGGAGAALLHPDRARRRPSTPDAPPSGRSSPASSLNSVAGGRSPPDSDPCWEQERRRGRRVSSLSVRSGYSLLDALDLEWALARAAVASSGRGSIAAASSHHKLTFTQSLAFPALAARATGLSSAAGTGGGKRARGGPRRPRRRSVGVGGGGRGDSCLTAAAKAATAIALVILSVAVFALVYKFVGT